MKRALMIVAMVGVIAMAGPAHATLYNDAVLADNPLLYWTFDEASGNAFSQVNNTTDNDLEPIGGATRAPSTTTTGGVSLGSAASFNGTENAFYAADLFGPGTQEIASSLYAVELWFNVGANAAYLSGAGGDWDAPAIFYGSAPETLTMFQGWSGQHSGGATASAGDWHHAVLAFYGNAIGFEDNLREIYIDGALVTSDTTSAYSGGHALTSFRVGNRDRWGIAGPTGLIDEYAIYDLSALGGDLATRRAAIADIAEHYNVAVPIPEPAGLGLIGLALLAVRRRRK